jgi:PAS domain S-box-containing protein
MSKVVRGVTAGYAVAVCLVGVAFAGRVYLNPYMPPQQSTYVLFIAPVALAAFYVGTGPGLLAWLLSLGLVSRIAGGYPWQANYWLAATLYTVVCLVLLVVSRRARRDRESHRQSTCDLENRLRDVRAAKKFTEGIIRSAHDPIILMDGVGTVVEWNPAAVEVFGFTRDEAVGQELASMIVPPDLREAHRVALGKFLVRGTFSLPDQRLRATGVRKDGSRLPISVSISLLNDGRGGSGVPLFCGYITDLTVQMQHEQELREAKREAEQASVKKDRFLAMLSHELRTPLTPVVTTISLVQAHDGIPADVREDLDTIRRNVDIEVRLIDDLLDLSRVQNNKMRLSLGEVNLNELAASAADVLYAECNTKRTTLRLDLTARHPTVHGDPLRLRQVLWNLLQNACKFTPSGGEITLRTYNRDDRVVVEVRDTGVGLDPSLLPRLFNPFEQGIGHLRNGGMGLGLAICRAFVELHGGTIVADSQGPGTGSLFTVSLAGYQRAEREDIVMTGHATVGTGKGSRLLLVEDHLDTGRSMQRLLGMMGHTADLAGTVAEAIQRLNDGDYDLVVSDLGLPDGSGLDVVRHCHAVRVRAVALSGYGSREDVDASLAAGFVDHLIKPIDVTKLQAAIDKYLQKEQPCVT